MQQRGLGRVFQGLYKDPKTRALKRTNTWQIEYSFRGQKRRESSRSTNRADAVKLLRRRLAEMAQGRLVGPDAEKTTFEDLAQMIQDDYAINQRRSSDRVKYSLAHLGATFSRARAVDLTADRIASYIRARQEAGAASGTIQNELATLKRMFSLGLRAGKVTHKPYIPHLTLNNVRTGFFEEADYRALLRHLPDYLRPLITFLYLTGWRKSEALGLTWAQVDFQAGVVRLEPGTTKNREGRTFPFNALPELAALLLAQRELTEEVTKRTERIVPWVFHRNGHAIVDLRKRWGKACIAAGLPGRILHDFRRTAVRNLERAGVPRSVAMKLTGHKTESVYRRYAIVSEADLSVGVERLASLHRNGGEVSKGRVISLAQGR
jgi:integrase